MSERRRTARPFSTRRSYSDRDTSLSWLGCEPGKLRPRPGWHSKSYFDPFCRRPHQARGSIRRSRIVERIRYATAAEARGAGDAGVTAGLWAERRGVIPRPPCGARRLQPPFRQPALPRFWGSVLVNPSRALEGLGARAPLTSTRRVRTVWPVNRRASAERSI